MPKTSYEDFARQIAQYQAPPTPAMLQDLVTGAFNIDPDDIDEPVTDFTRSRIELAYRTGNVDAHLHHLYDVLTVLESKLAET